MVCIAFKFANYAKLRTKNTHLSRKFSWLFCSRWKAANFCHPGPLKNDNPKSFHPISKTKNYPILQLAYMGHIKVRSCTWLWTWVLRDIWFMISLTLYVWWRWCQHRAPDNSHTWHYSSFPGLLCDENRSKRNYSVKSLLMENINRDWSFIDHINCSHPPLFNTKMKKNGRQAKRARDSLIWRSLKIAALV